MSKHKTTTILMCLMSLSISTSVNAQSLLNQLATLLTEQRPSGTFVPDPAAAAATTNTVASLFLVELATGEVLGRRLAELAHLSDIYQPHPVQAGVDTMRWLPTERGVHTMFVVTGAKWNVNRSWLLNTNLLIRVTDAGLRAAVTPSVSVGYGFER